jgi:thiol-disulfide isomerase/thioredoxin
MVRSAVLTLAFLSLISMAKAQEPERDPANSDEASIPHGIAHHEEMIGQTVPDVTFTGEDGKETALSNYRGRPLLIDLWATWCAPCLANLPSLNRIYGEFKSKGLEFISLDQDGEEGGEGDAATAAKYLAQHHYQWKNFHDDDRRVAAALGCDGLPLVVLIDANGKIVYFDFGGRRNEAALRTAIAKLAAGAAPAAPSGTGNPDESSTASDRN